MDTEILGTKETARFLGISLSKLYKMCMDNEIEYYKVGSLNKFRTSELIQYFESCKTTNQKVDTPLCNIKMPRVV